LVVLLVLPVGAGLLPSLRGPEPALVQVVREPALGVPQAGLPAQLRRERKLARTSQLRRS
jgi:hypothetical protein